jgi:hypothetical protein
MSEALKPLIAAAADRPLTRAEAETAFAILFEGDATALRLDLKGFAGALQLLVEARFRPCEFVSGVGCCHFAQPPQLGGGLFAEGAGLLFDDLAARLVAARLEDATHGHTGRNADQGQEEVNENVH